MLQIACVDEAVPPGGVLDLVVEWDLQEDAERIDVGVMWETSGKGTEDKRLVHEETIEDIGRQGRRELAIPMPHSPYSFSGTLIDLQWTAEAVLRPSGQYGTVRFVLAPDGVPITLKRVPDEQKPKKGCITIGG